jgi:hypothetical protein
MPQDLGVKQILKSCDRKVISTGFDRLQYNARYQEMRDEDI